MERSKVGGIAAMISAALFVLVVLYTVGTVMVMGTDDDANGWGPYVLWIAMIALAILAAAVAVYGALKGTGGFGGAMAKFSMGLAVLAVPATSMAWFWFGWGSLISVSFLLLALHLRKLGFGIAGHKSLWDWTLPVGFLIGPPIMLGLYATVAEETENIDWGYTGGLSVSLLLAAATLFTMGRWLRADAPILQEAQSA